MLSSLTDPNDYAGPGTGLPHVAGAPRRGRAACARCGRRPTSPPSRRSARAASRLTELGPARSRVRPDEVVVGLSPAFAEEIWVALNGMTVARGAAPDPRRDRGGGAREPARPGRPLDRPRRDRLDRRAALGLRRLGRPAGQGHGADPPRRPAAARQPRALLDRPARDRRALPRPRPQRRALREGRSRVEPLLLPESSEPLGPRYHARVVQLVAVERRLCAAGRPRRAGGVVAGLTLSALGRRPRRRPDDDRPARLRDHARRRARRARSGPTTSGSAPATLRLQADFAEQGGNPQLAENLRRGAELVRLRRRRAARLLREAPAGPLDRGRARRAGAGARGARSRAAARSSCARPAPPTCAAA